MNLTSQFQRCNNIVNATLIIHPELSLLSNVEITLEQRCNSDILVSTSLKRCFLVVPRYHLTKTLSQRCVFTGLAVLILQLYISITLSLSYTLLPCVSAISLQQWGFFCLW